MHRRGIGSPRPSPAAGSFAAASCGGCDSALSAQRGCRLAHVLQAGHTAPLLAREDTEAKPVLCRLCAWQGGGCLPRKQGVS